MGRDRVPDDEADARALLRRPTRRFIRVPRHRHRIAPRQRCRRANRPLNQTIVSSWLQSAAMKRSLPLDGCCPVAQSLTAAHEQGEPARERLLLAGLRLFAEQGFAKTSIRQIALAAGANVAAVSYYFGNKAGLYRAVFWGGAAPSPGKPPQPGAARPSLDGLFEHILAPLRSGTQARLWIKLHR